MFENYIIFRLPFNWRTPFGYLVALTAQSLAAVSTLLCGTTAMSFGIGTCWLFINMAKDIISDFEQLNVADYSKKTSPTKAMQHFCNIVQCYADLKQLSSVNIVYIVLF